MLDHKTSVAPGKGPAAGHAAATPGKQTLTQGMSAKPKAPAPTAKSAAKPEKKGHGKGKGKKAREYTMWVHRFVEVINAAQVLDLDKESGAVAGTDAPPIPEGKRAQVVAEIVDGPIQIELTTPDPETGELRRVWIQREDATLLLEEEAGDQMSLDPEHESAMAQAGSEKTKAVTAAVCNLGQFKNLGETFCERGGALMEALVPELGDSSKLVLKGNIPINGGLFFFMFTGSVEKDNMIDDDQFKARLEFGVGWEAKVPSWIGDAFAQVSGFGFLEASGDSGQETLELMMYAIYRAVSCISQDAADHVMGGKAANVEDTMDREDYAQFGGGVRGAAGVKVGKKSLGGSVEGAASARYTGTGAKGHETGEVNAQTIGMAQAGVTFASRGAQFAGGAAVTADVANWSLLAANAAATATKTFDLADLKDLVGTERGANIIAAYGADALTAVGPIIGELVEKIFGPDSTIKASQKEINDHLGRTMTDISGARLLVALGGTAGAQKLASTFGSANPELAVPMSYEVGVEVEWKPGIGLSLSIQLKRISAIELGKENGEPGAYAKVENATRIFKISYNNQSWSAH